MKNSEVQVRRKPRQSRAKLTQEALQESFVRLLHERSAAEITIREITNLAGVGLGTFYEYFAKKEDLLALTIHLQVKQHAEHLKSYAQQQLELSTVVEINRYIATIIQFQLQQIQAQQWLWAQTFLLERQVSHIETYQKSYSMMLQMWQQIFAPIIHNAELQLRLALNLHRISYGFISQSLLINPHFQDWGTLYTDISLAIQPFLAAVSDI
ncbi:TetR/AcrR family transcriptional regulator [Acinetobacter towneri]|uniref:TetR/AcrR family transcriptional regulator n=1 Tax=Acinetobacter towneri TaxID=202956 RepID=A0AB35LZJ2_9GAMM|nr:TetR/AcrR family transcriptional regulator [Acinetobacter towneri]MDM1718778.1 TetR/AcrR family transcriptional regulator [Acinetobacter towneri]MDM1730894.1 TetR/AcrR family transcriptional regulator [Acinetobacter towneri]MDM1733558.1 TetR/AcrR family transcriptional regulator [Acinetobacter towneri]MDM1735925.1 TetR/AcrR family transcriptional regulator [Acinetobacter towneri]MDM1738893.1 TetR/AcrR family transcriptional regulator [Acinetobacter towneri]